MKREVTVKDLVSGIVGAVVFLLVMPDPGDLTKLDIIITFVGMIAVTVVLRHWLTDQVESVRAKREKLRIRERKVVDVRLHRPVHIPARKVFGDEV